MEVMLKVLLYVALCVIIIDGIIRIANFVSSGIVAIKKYRQMKRNL